MNLIHFKIYLKERRLHLSSPLNLQQLPSCSKNKPSLSLKDPSHIQRLPCQFKLSMMDSSHRQKDRSLKVKFILDKSSIILWLLFAFFFTLFCKLINSYMCTFYDFVSGQIQMFVCFTFVGVSQKYAFITFYIKFAFPRFFQDVTFTTKYFQVTYIGFVAIQQFIGSMVRVLQLNSVQSMN